MDSFVIPVANGVLPRPDGGVVTGIFVNPYAARVLQEAGPDADILLCPYAVTKGRLYPVGVMVSVQEAWMQPVYVGSPCGPYRKVTALFARVTGRGRFRAGSFWRRGHILLASRVEALDVAALRGQGYPAVDGAGWQAVGGHTRFQGAEDVVVTLEGVEYESGRRVEVTGNVGGIIPPDQAHTVEHGIIRALAQYAFCTPRLLREAFAEEGRELEQSLDVGFRLRLPEVFGVTRAGACGNPLSDLAHFYLARELVERLAEGEPFPRSLEAARNVTMSRLVEELELTDRAPFRVPRALKHGMFHDDTPMDMATLKRVLARFPASPWA
ncbi:MAG: hypothetical protein AB1446_00780 [Bacillota bacterium]